MLQAVAAVVHAGQIASNSCTAKFHADRQLLHKDKWATIAATYLPYRLCQGVVWLHAAMPRSLDCGNA